MESFSGMVDNWCDLPWGPYNFCWNGEDLLEISKKKKKEKIDDHLNFIEIIQLIYYLTTQKTNHI